MKYCKIQVFGKVQGVAFRYYTKLKADELGLRGTTENQIDGSVISFVIGDEEAINKFVKWCYEGSPASSVKSVVITEMSDSENQECEDFSILR